MTSLELIWKATAILLAAFAANSLLRRSSAALRHFVWTVTFAVLLVLPAILRIGPKWQTPVATPAVAFNFETSGFAEPKTTIPAIPLSTLWWAGFGFVAFRFLAGTARTAWLAARGREIGREGRVRIVESVDAPMPMTWGIFRPVVILPAEASNWPADRFRVVLLHELTHVRRRDLLAQAVAQIGCSLYWFHPLAWIAIRELRKERERACDDGVLHLGIPATEYADHLMHLARAFAARRRSVADAPAAAETSGLEARIRALLDRRRNRGPLRLGAAIAVSMAALAALLPLATFTAMAQGANGRLVGTIQDPSGGRIPGVVVTALNLDTTTKETTRSDAAGEYQFASLPSGRYLMEVDVRGFKPWRGDLTLVAGASARRDALLEVGGIVETVTVTGRPGGSQGANVPAPEAARVRVGGNIQGARLIRQPRAIYPEDLKQQGVQGVVKIAAILSKTGSLMNLQVTSGDPRLARAALDAVAQWRYEPTLLNGEPVEVVTQIEVTFDPGH